MQQTNLSLKTTNETSVLDDFLLCVLLRSQISERVNDDTEDKVEDDDDDHEEEEHVVDESEGVEGFRAGGRPEHISYATTIPQTLVESRDDAHPQGVAGPLLDGLLVKHGQAFILLRSLAVLGRVNWTDFNQEIICEG